VQSPVSRSPDRSRSELISEEVELDVRICPCTVSILAIDDLGFGGVQFHSAFRQSGLKFSLEGFSFLLGPAMHQPVICIPTPREVGVCPLHPEVERIVKKKI
jgi:hypothetical protein